ncbi:MULTISPECIES: type I-MYXAN CRISPR-associated endonuclease Cas4/Cas1 [Cyanophyceae]|uniref:type I-MYXAN CRISPR-associated endonuclease Cas4/Cas1 n=1 Tax=Cyanophyceae TaxID=3028117 RepID=UPI00016DCCA9|nr:MULTISPECIES: type I-MYXAN CRISPR-associated endonuclease Cas4/Cas1 [Cyanophyceae]ACA99766.1 putative CRISPR-associated protein [Picosynechococcus sp. PCC 7002]SMH55950.1 CRISPR-associated protein, Cas1 family /CRISPR-associated exonuclease, Cas4 family [Picosynechococcus sp. OG1]SMQ83357.1 CRISPR-associated protein, Cas1 family /CRISPR-associated exonuclease, Cas4 family [Synechococcus sp. 7002]
MFAPVIPETQPTIKVSGLHAIAYCPRLFYLEEVEGLYTQDAAVFAGRRLHVDLEQEEEGEWEDLYLESEDLGIRGRVDALRTRNGLTIPYEHKRGKAARDDQKNPLPWESDHLQIISYCYLLEVSLGISISEGRIRYHADNVLIHVPFDETAKAEVREAIANARKLLDSDFRPPVTENERLCARCSLAPVCLPEEARLAHDREWQPIRLFPKDDDRQILHTLEPGTRVGRTGEQIKITRRDQPIEKIAVQQVSQVVLHGFSQISTQALHFLASHNVGIHWISGGDRYIGSFDNRQGSIQRRIQQYRALSQTDFCVDLAKKLVWCRGQGQRKFLMRGKRSNKASSPKLNEAISQMKRVLKQVENAENLATLLGIEGNLAALYFGALPCTLTATVPNELRFSGRNRRPPKDRFNALLSFGYSLLLKDVMNSIIAVGLEPALGFYHQPRTQASPLALDLMEIFRVPLVDMVVIASINRSQWDITEDFSIRGQQVWLSDSGRKKFIECYERRKAELWKHPMLGYSLSYARLIELEVRLLEKEWSGEAGLFGQLIVR